MIPYITTFLIALVIAYEATRLVRHLARQAGVVDKPDGFRKLQQQGIPLLGGVGILLAFVVSLPAVWFLTGDAVAGRWLAGPDCRLMLAGAAAVLLTGVLDDVWGLRARYKFILTGAVSVLMYYGGYSIQGVSNPFGAPIQLALFAMPLTVFWFMGSMNAMNLIDGMDGLAAGVAVFAAATMCLVGSTLGNSTAALLAIALAGATLGFLILNFHPASIFLGDSGSLLLGFLLASIGLRSAQKSTIVVALLIPVIALGLPIMDTSLAILRRWGKKLPFNVSDRQHIHHKLLEMGLSKRKALLLMYGVCILLAGAAWLMTAAGSAQAAVLLAALGALTFLTVRIVGRHELKMLKTRTVRRIQEGRRQALRRNAAFVASASVRNADSVGDIWDIFTTAADTMGFDRAELALHVDDGEPAPTFSWPDGGQPADRSPQDTAWSAVYPLRQNGLRVGRLEVCKRTNGRPLGPDIPESLHLLSKALAINIARVQALPGRGAQPAALSTNDSDQ